MSIILDGAIFDEKVKQAYVSFRRKLNVIDSINKIQKMGYHRMTCLKLLIKFEEINMTEARRIVETVMVWND
jgi:predicted transport protein